MKKSGNYQRLRASFLAAALLTSGALNGQHALAQTAPAPATAIGAPSELDEIVVTGTTIKETIMQTSFAVTVVNQEALANSPALGLAALLTSIPEGRTAYIQADLDPSEAVDPLLPEVAWSWLVDALESRPGQATALGGTVTATTSVRYGDIAGPLKAHQLELRASWTAVRWSGRRARNA